MSEALLVEAKKCYEPQPLDIRTVTLDVINTAAQYRRKENPSQGALNQSIANRGLINPTSNVLLEPDNASEYVEFTNMSWGSEYDVDSYVPYYDENIYYAEDFGKYLLLIAGHSRNVGLHADAKRIGCDPSNYKTHVNVLHGANTVDQLLQIQLEENIHSTPDAQFHAKILAESYLYSVLKGEKVSKRRFAKDHGISEKAVTDALNYASLPKMYRDKTDEGILPFRVAAEMGRGLNVLSRYVIEKGMEEEEAVKYIGERLEDLKMKYVHYGKVMIAVQAIRSQLSLLISEMVPKAPDPQKKFDFIVEELTDEVLAERMLKRSVALSKARHLEDTAKLHNDTARYVKAKADAEIKSDDLTLDIEAIVKELQRSEQALATVGAI